MPGGRGIPPCWFKAVQLGWLQAACAARPLALIRWVAPLLSRQGGQREIRSLSSGRTQSRRRRYGHVRSPAIHRMPRRLAHLLERTVASMYAIRTNTTHASTRKLAPISSLGEYVVGASSGHLGCLAADRRARAAAYRSARRAAR